MLFDPLYLIFVLPAVLLAIWAQTRVHAAYAEASELRPRSGMSGAEAAAHILRLRGLNHVDIQQAHGFLGDHYDPRSRVLRLSPAVYHGRSLAAVGIAAHEAGHALQDAQGYAPLVIRNAVVPMAALGSSLSWFLLFFGLLIASFKLIMFGLAAYGAVVAFQLVNLPVEFDASARAKELLVGEGIVSPGERAEVSKVLNAAALTYVAATVTAVLTLLYYLFRFGMLSDRE
jgi:uncharacterized protein